MLMSWRPARAGIPSSVHRPAINFCSLVLAAMYHSTNSVHGVPAKYAKGASDTGSYSATGSSIGLASSAVTKFGSSTPSGVVPHDHQTSNESSTLLRHFGHRHIGFGLRS